jgi:hypothetical protein
MIAQGGGIAEALIDRGHARRGAGDGEHPPLRPLTPFLWPAVIYADKVVPKAAHLTSTSETSSESHSHDTRGHVQRSSNPQLTRMFDLLTETCRQLTLNLQIIVLDHVNLTGNEAFQSSIIDGCPWMNGRGLVAETWQRIDGAPQP